MTHNQARNHAIGAIAAEMYITQERRERLYCMSDWDLNRLFFDLFNYDWQDLIDADPNYKELESEYARWRV